jgi:subtilisin family serine protease
MLTGIASGRLLIERRTPGLEGTHPSAGEWAVAPSPAGPAVHPWDRAHQAVREPAAIGLESTAAPAYAEPDFVQTFPFPRADGGGLESGATGPCDDRGPDTFWPIDEPRHGWHLNADHSQLKSARDQVGPSPAMRQVRIVHLDTGYDPDHPSRPLYLRRELGRNFVDGDRADATDPGRHAFADQPGHGTGTLGLLAGNRVAVPATGFDDFLGGAPYAEVVPVRIANSVVHFQTSSMAAGISYAVEVGAWVVSVSMGGVPTRAWAAAVNRAYDAGVAIFAAAGNRFGPSPPSTIVWPARFSRVTAVCGITADGSPYYRPGLHRHLQGCFGPAAKMATALAACTPNTPWAMMGCGAGVGFGGGTSSATPQAAAAAALWLAAHTAPAGIAPWQRVEAVRNALFEAADRSFAESDTYFGRGVMKAAAALGIDFRTDVAPVPPDDVSFPWLRLLGGLAAAAPTSGIEQMYEVEALQVFSLSAELQRLAGGADPLTDPLPTADRRAVLETMRQSRRISEALRLRIDEVLRVQS